MAKTLKEFIKEYISEFNPITGERNLYKNITDEMVWNAAIKSVEENGNNRTSSMWRDEYNKWKNNHDWKCYKSRDEIDDIIVNKLSSMLDEMEKRLTSANCLVVQSNYPVCRL